MTDYHSGSLTLDGAEGLIESQADYEIAATWSTRDYSGFRQIIHASDVKLISWIFEGRQQTRATAVALMGEAWVAAQEDAALSEWRKTAEQDDADEYADYARDMRAESRWAAEQG